MIFYDDPILGRYQPRFDRIFTEPRYLDMEANRIWFAARVQQAKADRKPLAWWLDRAPWRNDPQGFTAVYRAYWRAVDPSAS